MDPRFYLLLVSSVAVLFTLHLPAAEGMPLKSSRQYLPPLPGYVPVYIQDGDTPPDVESIYEEVDGQSPTVDKMDTDVLDVPQTTDPEQEVEDSLRGLRESEQFIVQQLTDSVSDNEVRGRGRGRGIVEEAQV